MVYLSEENSWRWEGCQGWVDSPRVMVGALDCPASTALFPLATPVVSASGLSPPSKEGAGKYVHQFPSLIDWGHIPEGVNPPALWSATRGVKTLNPEKATVQRKDAPAAEIVAGEQWCVKTEMGRGPSMATPTIKTRSPAFLLFVLTWHIFVCNLDFELSESL